jgi:hypothetical protein
MGNNDITDARWLPPIGTQIDEYFIIGSEQGLHGRSSHPAALPEPDQPQ